jgi:hypothetical protein
VSVVFIVTSIHVQLYNQSMPATTTTTQRLAAARAAARTAAFLAAQQLAHAAELAIRVRRDAAQAVAS